MHTPFPTWRSWPKTTWQVLTISPSYKYATKHALELKKNLFTQVENLYKHCERHNVYIWMVKIIQQNGKKKEWLREKIVKMLQRWIMRV